MLVIFNSFSDLKYKNTFQIENLFKLSKMARQQSFILLWALLMIVPIGHSQTLPPNVTNILNQLLEQSLADQQQDINGDSSSLTPTNLAEIVRIFVQFLVAIFNAFQRIFAQSPMLRNDVMYKSWSDQDFAYNPNISFEKVLQDRKEKFNQIFGKISKILFKQKELFQQIILIIHFQIRYKGSNEERKKHSTWMILAKKMWKIYWNNFSRISMV